MSELATLEELPLDYRNTLTERSLVPLWPFLRAALPYEKPIRKTKPFAWKWSDVRPNLLKAGSLTPLEKAERRVLILANPGLGLETIRATPSIFIGMQLILPGEFAPTHKHSPSAIRMVVEGRGGWTTVQGERCPMEKGDLILTPSGLWHEHGHDGNEPVIWMDALDLPIVGSLEAAYAVDGAIQNAREEPDSSQTRYRRAGLVPYESLGERREAYPLRRFPWREVRESLLAFASVTPRDAIVQLAYVNPETGAECMPILGFSALMLRPGETARPRRRSTSAVLHCIEGEGDILIDGERIGFTESDTIAVPTHATVEIANRSSQKSAFLFQVDDAPMQRKLGFYEEYH